MTELEPDTGFRIDLWRARITLAIVAAAMVAGVALSWPLWMPDRYYPLSPVLDVLPSQPASWGELWIGNLLVLLVVSAFLPSPRFGLVPVILLAVPLAMWDQTRWQPWSYQYFAMILCLVAYPWGDPESPRRDAVLNALRLIVAFTYVWSGIHKININFATDVFPWLVKPIVPEEMRDFAKYGAFLPAFVEAALGAGLMMAGTRPLAVLGLLGMHATILYCLGPLGHDWNTVVWPWNLAMMLLLVVLFVGTPRLKLHRILWPGRSIVQWLALILFGVMPGFSFVERWDHYLSAALYSGDTPHGNVTIGSDLYESLPIKIRNVAYPTGDGRYHLTLINWAIAEMNVPEYPAARVSLAIGRDLAARSSIPVEVHLQHSPHWLTGERREERILLGGKAAP